MQPSGIKRKRAEFLIIMYKTAKIIISLYIYLSHSSSFLAFDNCDGAVVSTGRGGFLKL